VSDRSAPDVVVRRATPADHDAIGELTVAAYADFTDGPEDGYIDHLRDAARRDREAELWVAERDGEILGTVTLTPEGSAWRETAQQGEGEFRMLAVSPAARRQGVGETLTQLVIDRFRELGAHAVVLSSLDEMTAAHRVYERLGFRRVPERDWSPQPGVNLIAFRLDLPIEATLTFTVTDDDTAAAVGSGSLPVLATPRLLTWFEAAAFAALEPRLPAGSTSVGTRVAIEHLGASPVGQQVQVTASSSYADGRLHRFTVAARHLGGNGRVVGSGEVTRVVVDAERFLSRL
jgi:predicted thioesterase/ribosomal protein S18 acetylase RimI-like enzyme